MSAIDANRLLKELNQLSKNLQKRWLFCGVDARVATADRLDNHLRGWGDERLVDAIKSLKITRVKGTTTFAKYATFKNGLGCQTTVRLHFAERGDPPCHCRQSRCWIAIGGYPGGKVVDKVASIKTNS